MWGVSGVWTVLCGYGMYSFDGNVWCVDCVVWLRSVLLRGENLVRGLFHKDIRF